MRTRFRVLILAGMVAAVVVPVGFALSLDSSRRANSSGEILAIPAGDVVATQAPMIASSTFSRVPRLPDGARLLLVGAALFGLAAAMRRGS